MADKRRLPVVLLAGLEAVLIVIGIGAIGWYTNESLAAGREQESLSRELDRVAARDDSVVVPRPPRSPRVPRTVVGRIDVPRLRLSALAREGVDLRTLRVAVGHIPGTALPGELGNSGFAAHRDSFFRPLQSVRKGDEVLVTTPDSVYHYTVTGTSVVEPADISVLDPTTAATLTLVTCYPFDYVGSAPQRFIVHAALQR